MNVNRKTGQINSIFQKHRERFAFTVKKYENDNAEKIQIGNLLEDVEEIKLEQQIWGKRFQNPIQPISHIYYMEIEKLLMLQHRVTN